MNQRKCHLHRWPWTYMNHTSIIFPDDHVWITQCPGCMGHYLNHRLHLYLLIWLGHCPNHMEGYFHFIRGLAPSMNLTEYHHLPDDWPYLNHVEGIFILSQDLDPLWIAQSIIFPDDWPYLNHTDSILSEDWDPLYESHRVTSSSHMTGTLSESQIFVISAEECGLLWASLHRCSNYLLASS